VIWRERRLGGFRGSRFCKEIEEEETETEKDNAEARSSQRSAEKKTKRDGSRRWAPAFFVVGKPQRSGLGHLAGIVKAAAWLPHSKWISVAQGVDDRDAGFYFDGATVEDGGAIAPLADRS
jgi:hypothetical protein